MRHIEASYLQSWLPSKFWGDWRTTPTWLWRLSAGHGSKGALGDVGVHIIDFATYPVGHISSVCCRLKAFRKAPRDRVGEYVLDANDSAVLSIEEHPGGISRRSREAFIEVEENSLGTKSASKLAVRE
jgi:predicted dehydrogenase